MNEQTARNILTLLDRVELKGSEVDAYVEARAELRAIVQKAEKARQLAEHQTPAE